MERDSLTPAPVPPAAASAVFGDGLRTAVAFVSLLVREGPRRGLIGPREVDRLWDRHVLNSAVLAEALPEGSDVVDVGSGAGFPGIPLVIARPDLRVTCLEPMLRRVTWLDEVVTALGLEGRVTVRRGRAEEVRDRTWDVVTSRAVAPLERLLPMCAPLVRPDGLVVAAKGDRAAEELETVAPRLDEWGLAHARVARFGERVLTEPTTAVVLRREGRGGRRGSQTVTGATGRDRRMAGGAPARSAGRGRST